MEGEIKFALNSRTLEVIHESLIDFLNGKFDKYWSECNSAQATTNILDLRCKLMVVEYCFQLVYSVDEAKRELDHVKDTMKKIYELYEIKKKTLEDLNELAAKGQKVNSSSSFKMLDDNAYN